MVFAYSPGLRDYMSYIRKYYTNDDISVQQKLKTPLYKYNKLTYRKVIQELSTFIHMNCSKLKHPTPMYSLNRSKMAFEILGCRFGNIAYFWLLIFPL